MIPRRAFLGAAGALAAFPSRLWAAETGEKTIDLKGSLEQASLVVGNAGPGARVSVDGTSVRVSVAGLFAFGLIWDGTKSVEVVARMPDGAVSKRIVAPVMRQYEIQKINGLPEKYVSPPKEILERIARENAMVGDVRKRDTDGVAFAQSFDWPVKGIVSGTFGSQRIDNGKPMAPHFGVDIAAPAGASIHAPADGMVSLAEPDFYLTGGTTVLDHGYGVSTVYIHQNALEVKAGDAVKRGDVIGLVGQKGRATGPHLHWGMNWFEMRLDPSRSTATPAPEKG